MDCKSVGIRIEAQTAGIREIELLATNGKAGDARIEVYQVGPVRVASTNGDPVWEKANPQEFAELLEAEGMRL